MKKVASILAVALFAVSMFATQAENVFDFDIDTMISCGDCNDEVPDRENGGNGTA